MVWTYSSPNYPQQAYVADAYPVIHEGTPTIVVDTYHDPLCMPVHPAPLAGLSCLASVGEDVASSVLN